jgi:hypothetical protein
MHDVLHKERIHSVNHEMAKKVRKGYPSPRRCYPSNASHECMVTLTHWTESSRDR